MPESSPPPTNPNPTSPKPTSPKPTSPKPASETPDPSARVAGQARLLAEEEYIEQAYFFRTFRQRLEDQRPSQEILRTVGEEILATTKLPIAIDFLAGEVERRGRMSGAMRRLSHYFTAFQTFVIDQAEDDRSKFPFVTALHVLQREAEYRAGLTEASDDRDRRAPQRAEPAGLFTYQFEAVARNRLGYSDGLAAIAADPLYAADPNGEAWQTWMAALPHRIGMTDFGELIYRRSEQFVVDQQRQTGDGRWQPSQATLFGLQEGRIAKANRGRDPLYLFAALQRQLGYPQVPRTERVARERVLDPAIELRFQQIEAKLLMLENEQKGTLGDLLGSGSGSGSGNGSGAMPAKPEGTDWLKGLGDDWDKLGG